MATYSSILAWRIPWTEEPDGLQSIYSYYKTLAIFPVLYNISLWITLRIMDYTYIAALPLLSFSVSAPGLESYVNSSIGNHNILAFITM